MLSSPLLSTLLYIPTSARGPEHTHTWLIVHCCTCKFVQKRWYAVLALHSITPTFRPTLLTSVAKCEPLAPTKVNKVCLISYPRLTPCAISLGKTEANANTMNPKRIS